MTITKQLTCSACGLSVEPTLVLTHRTQDWNIVRCPECSLTFVHPQPPSENILAYYNGMYSELAKDFNAKKMEWARTSVAGYLSTLTGLGHSSKGSLLDIGGGLGYYSKAFEDAGLTVTLVEPDPVSAQFARGLLKNSHVIEQTSEQFLQSNQKVYDIVFMRHVIEHSTNPCKLIQNVSNCLSEKGMLIIETDNNAGIELLCRPGTALFYWKLYRSSFSQSSFLALLKKRPFAVDPPRHLYGFRLSNLSRLLERHALIPIKKKCYRLGHPIYWPNLPLPTARQIINDILHLRLLYTIANLADIVVFPMRLFLEAMGLASGICIYARKDFCSQQNHGSDA